MEEKSIKDVLRDKILFLGCSEGELTKISRIAMRKKYSAGKTIIQQDTPGEILFVIESGVINILKEIEETGESIHICSLSGADSLILQYEGDFFGEMAILDIEPRSATIVTETECMLIEIHRSQLYQLFKQNKELHLIMTINLARILSRRIRKLQETLNHIGKGGDYKELNPHFFTSPEDE